MPKKEVLNIPKHLCSGSWEMCEQLLHAVVVVVSILPDNKNMLLMSVGDGE